MLTVLAHLVFWPFLVWNFIFGLALFSVVFDSTPTKYTLDDVKLITISLIPFFVSGIYIFGIF
jgi:hypothetical protein